MVYRAKRQTAHFSEKKCISGVMFQFTQAEKREMVCLLNRLGKQDYF